MRRRRRRRRWTTSPPRSPRPSAKVPEPAEMYLGKKTDSIGTGGTSILDAIDSESLWRRWFKTPPTWAPWRALLKTFFGLPLDEAELQLFQRSTRRTAPPPTGYLGAWLVIRRQGGKTLVP